MRLDSWLKITKDDEVNRQALKIRLVAINPEYLQRERLGLDTTDIDKYEPLYKEIADELWVPRGLVYRFPDAKVEDMTVLGYEVDFKSRVVPRDDRQKSWIDELLRSAKNTYGVIGQAPAGSGKTIMTLEVAARLGRTTGVLVHKEFLQNQWIDRILQAYDISLKEVGLVRQDVCDFQGKKIVVMMIQSLLSREYPVDLYRYFGTILIDEVHHMGASEFRKVITMFPARYRIGISATVKRKDGLEKVFILHIGPVGVMMGKDSSDLKPEVKMVKTGTVANGDQMATFYRYGMVNWPRVVSYLIRQKERNEKIADLLMKALKAGRKILLLSARRKHLVALYDLIQKKMKESDERYTVGYFVGGMDEKELTISATRQLLLATYAMAQEALDIPELDTLFLATPLTGSLEQAVGRILRISEGKSLPMVVDFVDERLPMCLARAQVRRREYTILGYVDK